MREYRYTSEKKNITIIEEALKTCSIGIGFAILNDIQIEEHDDWATIIFIPKDPNKYINPMEFFSFGLIIGTEYLT